MKKSMLVESMNNLLLVYVMDRLWIHSYRRDLWLHYESRVSLKRIFWKRRPARNRQETRSFTQASPPSTTWSGRQERPPSFSSSFKTHWATRKENGRNFCPTLWIDRQDQRRDTKECLVLCTNDRTHRERDHELVYFLFIHVIFKQNSIFNDKGQQRI